MSLVSHREILLRAGKPSAHWERRDADQDTPGDSPPGKYDPFAGVDPPPGMYHPIGCPSRRRDDFDSDVRRACHCRQPTVASEPCRNGEWVRQFCSRCKRTLTIVSAD